MRIYNPEPDYVVRLQITKQGEPTEYLTLCEATMDEVRDTCMKVVEALNLSPFAEGRRTSVNIREAKGAKNGRSISFSFFGLSAKETMEAIVKHVESL